MSHFKVRTGGGFPGIPKIPGVKLDISEVDTTPVGSLLIWRRKLAFLMQTEKAKANEGTNSTSSRTLSE